MSCWGLSLVQVIDAPVKPNIVVPSAGLLKESKAAFYSRLHTLSLSLWPVGGSTARSHSWAHPGMASAFSQQQHHGTYSQGWCIASEVGVRCSCPDAHMPRMLVGHMHVEKIWMRAASRAAYLVALLLKERR